MMGMRWFGRVCVAMGLLTVALSCPVRAANWEWTEELGWSRSEEPAKPTPAAQYAYAESYESKSEYYDAARQYFLLVRTYPDSPEAGKAMTRLASVLFELENYYHCFKAIEDTIAKYPRSADEAKQQLMELEFLIAEKFMDGAPRSLFSHKNTDEERLSAAIEVYQAIIKNDPFGPNADRAYYGLGRAYNESKQPDKARETLQKLISDMPESRFVPLARYQISLANMQSGGGTGTEAQKQLQKAKTALEQAPDSSKAKGELSGVDDSMTRLEELEAGRMYKNAEFYERLGSAKSVKSAVFTYNEIIRRYPNTKAAAAAQDRVQNIEIPKEGGKLMLPSPKLDVWPFNKGEKEKDKAKAAAIAAGDQAGTSAQGPVGATPMAAGGFSPDSPDAANNPFASPHSPVPPVDSAVPDITATPYANGERGGGVEMMTKGPKAATVSVEQDSPRATKPVAMPGEEDEDEELLRSPAAGASATAGSAPRAAVPTVGGGTATSPLDSMPTPDAVMPAPKVRPIAATTVGADVPPAVTPMADKPFVRAADPLASPDSPVTTESSAAPVAAPTVSPARTVPSMPSAPATPDRTDKVTTSPGVDPFADAFRGTAGERRTGAAPVARSAAAPSTDRAMERPAAGRTPSAEDAFASPEMPLGSTGAAASTSSTSSRPKSNSAATSGAPADAVRGGGDAFSSPEAPSTVTGGASGARPDAGMPLFKPGAKTAPREAPVARPMEPAAPVAPAVSEGAGAGKGAPVSGTTGAPKAPAKDSKITIDLDEDDASAGKAGR